MLQTRNGMRSAEAMLRIAVDMVDEGLLAAGGGDDLAGGRGPGPTAAAAPPGSRGEPVVAATGRAGLPGCGERHRGVLGRRGRAAGARGGERDPRARRDHPGRLSRHGGGQGHPDLPRGQDEPRGDRGRGHGHPGGDRGHRAGRRRGGGRAHDPRRVHRARGGVDHDRRRPGTVYVGQLPLLPPDPHNPYLERVLSGPTHFGR